MTSPSPFALEHVSLGIVRDLSLSVSPGSVYALLGRNGSGKTTTLRALLGLARPTAGRGLLFGEDAWRARAAAMARIGVVAEDPDAPPHLSADALGRVVAPLYPRWDARAYEARLDRATVPRKTPFARLSKGQRAQVSLALALGGAPQALVLDDPTLGLDVVARRELFGEVIGELTERGTTILVTTHDLAGIEALATHVGVIARGRLVLDGEIEALKARFRHVRFARQKTIGPELGMFRTLSVSIGAFGIDAVLAAYQEESFERWRRSVDAGDVDVTAMTLEEIFTAAVDSGEKGATP
jgi:ABC-2 type transport system ATP-binding protein